MSWAAVVVGVVGTGYKIYDSARKSSQAKKLAASNQRPVYNPDGSIREVYDLATNEVQNPAMQDFISSQLEQGQSNGIDAILKSGGRADFGVVNQQYGNQLRQSVADLMRSRDAKIAAQANAAYNLARSKDTAFSYNKDAPYKDLKQQEAQLRQQSEQSKADAISTAASTVANYGIATSKPGEDDDDEDTGATAGGSIGRWGNYNQNNGFNVSGTGLTEAEKARYRATGELTPSNTDNLNGYFEMDGRQRIGTDEYGNPIYAH